MQTKVYSMSAAWHQSSEASTYKISYGFIRTLRIQIMDWPLCYQKSLSANPGSLEPIYIYTFRLHSDGEQLNITSF